MEDKTKQLMDVFTSEAYKPMKLKELAILLDVPKEKREEFADILQGMIRDGRINVTNHGKYFAVKAGAYSNCEANTKIRGTFFASARGFGFVKQTASGETGENASDIPDIYIEAKNVNGAMHKDEVEAVILYTGDKHPVGKVTAVLQRANETVMGTLVMKNSYGFVIPERNRFMKDIYIPKEAIGEAQNNSKVWVKITDFGDSKRNPEGEILSVLGDAADPRTDIEGTILAYGLPVAFPEEVIREAKSIPPYVTERDIVGREDLRKEVIVTIDGEDAKDLDDGVSVTENADGTFSLGVHIADVSHYVKEGSALDTEAKKRGNSVYFPDRVIPMLPKELSNEICSLNAGVDRLAMSCLMTVDAQGRIIDHRVVESVIRVTRRMSYNEVSALLEDTADDALKTECEGLIPMFQAMAKLSALIRKRRKQHGAIDFDFPEPKAVLDENGFPIDIYPYKRSVATDMIEDFMLAANETIANVAFWENLPFIYRNHEAPADDRMEEFVSFLGGFGVALHLQNEVHPKKLQQVLDVTAHEAEGPLIHRVLLRCMKQARYGSECLGHFGLAMEHYTHFTSPIRRYPDLQIHRLLKAGLDSNISEAALGEIAAHCSATERKAAEAEREVMKYFKALYMQSEIGRIHKGVISGVTNGGIFVELHNTVEGVIRLSSLNDHYVLDETNYRLVGERTGRVFTLGQRVKIEVLDVDLTMAQVIFGLVEESRSSLRKERIVV